MTGPESWKLWWQKRRLVRAQQAPDPAQRINSHMARAGAFIRYPVEGEVLEGPWTRAAW